MFHVYVIRCEEGRHYIGSTEDVAARLAQHNSKQFRGWTNRYNHWSLIHSESFATRSEAIVRERQIKSMKGGTRFRELLGS